MSNQASTSNTNLKGRQADLGRSDEYVMGGFAEDGREVIKKDYKSGKPAEKPDFFMGGCGPAAPTGPKRKLRASWMAASTTSGDSTTAAPARVEHVPKPTKKWTPLNSKKLPGRSKSHDGTMATTTAGVRKGKKPAFPKKKVEAEEEEEEAPVPKEEEAEETVEPVTEPVAAEKETESAPTSVPTPVPVSPEKKKEEPAWTPAPALNIRKSKPTKAEMDELLMKREETEAAAATTNNKNGHGNNDNGNGCTACTPKDELIAKQAAQIKQLQTEKGALAKQVKQIKGSQRVNADLKTQVYDLERQVAKQSTHVANSKAFSKLESKLNTLKMILDGKVNKNDMDDLQEHVSMLNMILNQDLTQTGTGKNVWA